jgi:DNA repair protein RecO (recombination protein O)
MGGLGSSEALLLDALDLHDGDRIVTFLTPDRGKKRGVARGAKRKYSRFSGQLQPLAKVRIGWFEKEGRELVRISSVDLLRPAHSLQQGLEGILLTSYMADHMSEFAQENEPSEMLYRLLDSTLEALLAGADPKLATRFYEAWMLRLAGIFPSPEDCPLCGEPFSESRSAILPPQGDALLCRDCASEGGLVPRRALRVSPEAIEFLTRIGHTRLATLAGQPLVPRSVLDEVERLCGAIRRPFLGRELKSYEMMRQTLSLLPG